MRMTRTDILAERRASILQGSTESKQVQCDGKSVSGAVSQRACMFCGARVVLNPIVDAVHIVHGPIGCASYTWDIRGSLSSGPELYRNSFSTDMREKDVIFGGEKKLAAAIDEAVARHTPKAVFVLATCIVGVIGDDVDGVCRAAETRHGIPVLSIKSSGFAGSKSAGYKAAGGALLSLMERTWVLRGGMSLKREIAGEANASGKRRPRVNFLGDFNLAGETWMIRGILNSLGIDVGCVLTGDARVADIAEAPFADFNIVQCAGSMTALARYMEEKFNIPFHPVSFFGVEDTSRSLLEVAEHTKDAGLMARTRLFVESEASRIQPELARYRKRLSGKKAAVYVGGGFKAISLITQFRELGMETVLVGTQTGRPEEYAWLRKLASPGCVILDDANPAELERFMRSHGADILVGGVKERPLAYKLGLAFCDHNHERKHALCGFEGVLNFASEVDRSVNSPVWRLIRAEKEGCA
jgi:nitrogenase molybdenum-cofactor synthesis protein NifE